MRIVISSEAEKSSLQTDKGRAKVERGSTQVLFSRDDDTGETVFQQARGPPRIAALDGPFQRKGRE